MHGLRISTSLYDEDVKSSVNMLCHLLGAKYTERLGRNKNTHLVVPYAEGKKYEAAVGWGLHAVTVEWLHACIEAGRKVEERDFKPPPPPSDDDQNGDDGRAGAFTTDGGDTQEAPPPPVATSAKGSDRRRSAGIDIGGGNVCGGSQRGALNLVGSAVQRDTSRAAQTSQRAPPSTRRVHAARVQDAGAAQAKGWREVHAEAGRVHRRADDRCSGSRDGRETAPRFRSEARFPSASTWSRSLPPPPPRGGDHRRQGRAPGGRESDGGQPHRRRRRGYVRRGRVATGRRL